MTLTGFYLNLVGYKADMLAESAIPDVVLSELSGI